jgi:phosphoribosyl-ATP pyrophosphohydrolase
VKGKKPYSEDSCEPVVAKKEAEYKWHKSKDLHRDVTNGRHYPFSFLTGEAKELVDAIKNRDMANFKEEIGDTSYAAQMLAAQTTGLNHPVYADLRKFYDREKVWKEMFKEKGSSYHPKHMEGGSNYAKASKIIKAFSSAGIKVDQKEAERLANHYTGGKMEKEAAGMPAHMWKAVQEKNAPMIASAARRGVETRARNKAARELKRLINIDGSAPSVTSEAPWQDMFHFDRSHLFEQLKKTIDPAYVPDRVKYLGR